MKINELFEDVITEDLRYEFKAILNQENPIKWAKTLVAFANGNGGILFVGVSDNMEAFGLSLSEIDKAKRAYDNVNVGKELSALRKKYNRPAPIFFKEIDEKGKENEYAFYDTAMDYIYQAVKKFNFVKGKRKRVNYMPISWVVGENTTSDNATDYRHRDKIIEICEEYRKKIDRLYMELRVVDNQEKEVLYERIEEEKAERDKQVSKWLTSRNILIFVARHYEKNRPSDWRIYAPINRR